MRTFYKFLILTGIAVIMDPIFGSVKWFIFWILFIAYSALTFKEGLRAR